MAIQSRRGNYNKFDISKLLPGEWAVVADGDENSSDGMSVYLCFKAGIAKRMATYEDMEENVAQATKGERGTIWYFGTDVTGTNTSGTVFPDTGINNAIVNDVYVNETTWNLYECTLGGSASIAKWAYVGCIKGQKGDKGEPGDLTLDSKIEFDQALSRTNVEQQDTIPELFAKCQIWFSQLKNVAFSASYNDLEDLPEDSGWVSLNPTGNYEGISAHPPRVRKIGNMVEVSGGIRNNANQIAGSTAEVTLVTIPSGYRPSKMVISEGSTSTSGKYQLRINTDGTLTASRATSPGSTGYTSIPATTALFFHAVYFVA